MSSALCLAAGLVAAVGPGGASAAGTSVTTGYDVFSSTGIVYNEHGAGFYGDEKGRHLASPVVSMAVLRDGEGYWLATAAGSVYAFGKARFYGSLVAQHPSGSHRIVAMEATPAGHGYWLVAANGTVSAFGNAGHLVSHGHGLSSPVVAAAATPSGHGMWLVSQSGEVKTDGSATNYGEPAPDTSGSTAISPVPGGRGYFVTDLRGDVFSYGAARSAEVTAASSNDVVGITAETASSYLAVTSGGVVIPGGDGATSSGGTAVAAKVHVAGIVSAASPPPRLRSPVSGSVGFDVSWPQCSPRGSLTVGRLPSLQKNSFAVVGVDGWAFGSDNPCLSAEVLWARRATFPYDLYLFVNSPSPSAAVEDSTGPRGTCARLRPGLRASCLSYNYGYNSALGALSYASSEDATSKMWWLDVENGTCHPGEWSDLKKGEWWSCDTTLNADTILGAVSALRRRGIKAGVYCTKLQWQQITGGYLVPGGMPLWIAGARWTSPPYPARYHYAAESANDAFCAGDYDFGGGVVRLLQETPGRNGYPFDPDYAC